MRASASAIHPGRVEREREGKHPHRPQLLRASERRANRSPAVSRPRSLQRNPNVRAGKLPLRSRRRHGGEHEYPDRVWRPDPWRIAGWITDFVSGANPGRICAEGCRRSRESKRAGACCEEGDGQHEHDPDKAPPLASSRRQASALRESSCSQPHPHPTVKRLDARYEDRTDA